MSWEFDIIKPSQTKTVSSNAAKYTNCFDCSWFIDKI